MSLIFILQITNLENETRYLKKAKPMKRSKKSGG